MSIPDDTIEFVLQSRSPDRSGFFWGTLNNTFTKPGDSSGESPYRLPAKTRITIDHVDYPSAEQGYQCLLCSGTFPLDGGTQRVNLTFARDGYYTEPLRVRKEAEVYGKLREVQGKLVPKFYGVYSSSTKTTGGQEVVCSVIEKFGECAESVFHIPVALKVKMMHSLLHLHKEYKLCHNKFSKYNVLFNNDQYRFVRFDNVNCQHKCNCGSIFDVKPEDGSYNMMDVNDELNGCKEMYWAATCFVVTRVDTIIGGKRYRGDLPDAKKCQELLASWGLSNFKSPIGGDPRIQDAFVGAQRAMRLGKSDDYLRDKILPILQQALLRLKEESDNSSRPSGQV